MISQTETPAGTRRLQPKSYFRLPWSLTDNGISWLEVTPRCNLACVGCYRDTKSGHHKSLREIASELAVFRRERNSDCMSVAGGDPLVHPEIVEITRMIRQGGWKPIINTNGLALTRELLRDLKRAGVFGFTFHVDTSQKRPDSPTTSEEGHNRLRQRLAEMLASEGGIACSFNQTVVDTTLDQVPDVVRWAAKHPDIVHTVVFILYREPRLMGQFDYYANGERIDVGQTYEETQWGGDRVLKAQDVVDKIREVEPTFEPSAYLNGTVDPESTKWLIGVRVATKDTTLGYVSPRFMEAVQYGSHWIRRRWLSYSDPRFLSHGRAAVLAFSPFDKGMRDIAFNYARHVVRRPTNLLRRAHLQAITIIQPIDFLPDGRQNMCDGCPDITVHEGKLYWSCRLEEIKQYGCFVHSVPRTVQQTKRPENRIAAEGARASL
ncbi:MAG: radical SAM protein [Myxococcales bacterium]|jgi:pyruvate-formate lyase-activating enzyme